VEVHVDMVHKHWHGAAPTSAMTHWAVSGSLNGNSVLWMARVTDEEYDAAAASTQDLPTSLGQATPRRSKAFPLNSRRFR
jgi:4-carboxymuconolactone decarboxylase